MLQFNFEKSLDLDLKNLRLSYWARINFMIYMLDLNTKNKWTSLLDSDWFYDISELEL